MYKGSDQIYAHKRPKKRGIFILGNPKFLLAGNVVHIVQFSLYILLEVPDFQKLNFKQIYDKIKRNIKAEISWKNKINVLKPILKKQIYTTY